MNQSNSRNKTPSHQSRLVLDDKAVRKEMQAIPEKVRDQFLVSLALVCNGLEPVLHHEKLKAAGEGVVELKVNGRPAYRCMYAVDKAGDVVVLHVTSKTTQGQDRQLINTTSQRRKRLISSG